MISKFEYFYNYNSFKNAVNCFALFNNKDKQIINKTKYFAIIIIASFILSLNIANVNARSKFAAMTVDGKTGRVLFSRNADSYRYPASLTKVMTLYIIFEDLRAGRIKRGTRFRVSKYASSRPPSKLGLRPGHRIRVIDAIRALVTKSANDVATTVAEGISGSESRFASRMTRTAKRLGMTRTTFKNASGLPNRYQRTTARDMATLALRIQKDFPEYYHYFKTRRFKYRGRVYGNHNRLLGRYSGTDGIKTGYTRASGYNLTSSVRRGRKHLIGVVMGARSGGRRNRYMMHILNKSFRKASSRRSRVVASLAGRPPGYKHYYKSKKYQVASIKKNNFASTKYKIKPRTKPTVSFAPRKFNEVKLASISNAPVPRTKPIALAESKPEYYQSKKNIKVAINENNDINDLRFSPESISAIPSSSKSRSKQKHTTSYSKKNVKIDTWAIQVGAFSNNEEAAKYLENVRQKVYGVLKERTAFTMGLHKNNAEIYRARFAGFSNGNSAAKACSALKIKSIKCFIISPSARGA